MIIMCTIIWCNDINDICKNMQKQMTITSTGLKIKKLRFIGHEERIMVNTNSEFVKQGNLGETDKVWRLVYHNLDDKFDWSQVCTFVTCESAQGSNSFPFWIVCIR